jgi:hypothetical protein
LVESVAKTKAPRPDDYLPSEATKRRDAALRAALTMPPILHAKPAKKKKAASKRRPTSKA